MNKEHPIFAKDYVRPREEKKLLESDDQVPNPNFFFSGLPEQLKKQSKKHSTISFVPRVVAAQSKLDRANERQQKVILDVAKA